MPTTHPSPCEWAMIGLCDTPEHQGPLVLAHSANGVTVVEAWDRTPSPTTHSVVRSNPDADGDHDAWLGLVTARPLPAHVEAMPGGSPERMAAAVDHHASLVVEAYAAISAAFPHLEDHPGARWERGRVEVDGNPEAIECERGCGAMVVPNFLGIAWCGEECR